MRFRATYTYKSLGWYDGEQDWRTEVETVDVEAPLWTDTYRVAEEAIERELSPIVGPAGAAVPYTVLSLELLV